MKMQYDKTANNKPANAGRLYFNDAEFKVQQNNINNHENAQKLDVSALSAQEVSGTECVDLLIEHWKDVASVGDEFRKFGTGVLDQTLSAQADSIIETDKNNADSFMIAPGGKAMTVPFSAPTQEIFIPFKPYIDKNKPLEPFDNIGKFGGDQGDLGIGNKCFWIWVINEDDDVYDLFDKYPEYKDLSRPERHDFLEEIAHNGCTFTAMANTIFEHFKNRPKDFEKTFGFSMIGKDGDLNYKMLIVDIFLETGYKIFLDEPEGMNGLEEAYLFDTDKNFNDMFNTKDTDTGSRMEVISDYIKKAWESGNPVVTTKCIQTNCELFSNRLSHYCRKKGLDPDIIKYTDRPNNMDIKVALAKGYLPVIQEKRFNLENAKGDIVHSNDSDSGHAMTVVDITEDGRYKVSSWGEVYYFNPNKQPEKNVCEAFYLVRYKNLPSEVGIQNNTLYDDVGTYGGNVSNIKDKFTKEELKAIVKNYPGYANCTDEDINKLISEYIKSGSSYVAMSNLVMNGYNGHQKEFEEKFKIPMYRKDNELNVDLLALIFYMETGSTVYFDSSDGIDCCADYIYNYYANNPDVYKLNHNIDLYEGETYISSEKIDELKERSKHEAELFKEIYQKGGRTDMELPWGEETNGRYSIKNRLEHIFKERGINAEVTKIINTENPEYAPEIDKVKEALDKGYEVVLFSENPSFRDTNDNSYMEGINESHSNIMTVTGTIGEGKTAKYVVSCSGKQYHVFASYKDEIYAVKINN